MVLCFGAALSKAFKTIRPIFRERGKINAEVTGRLTESLGGVRVIKGYHAEDREARVFAGGVQRLLENVRRSLTAMSLMSLSATVLMGIVGALVMYIGTRADLRGQADAGRLRHVRGVSGLPDRARHRHRQHRNADSARRWPAWSARAKCCANARRMKIRSASATVGPIVGEVVFDHVRVRLRPRASTVLHGISFDAKPGTVTAFVGPSGSG